MSKPNKWGGGGWKGGHKVEKPGYEYTQASSQS